MSAVVPYEPSGRAWVALQNPATELANAIAGTEFVPRSLRGNPAAIAACILYGDEVGLGPMQSLAKVAVIDGRPALSAEAQRALILQAGHDLWIEEATNTRCTVAGRRHDSEQTSRVTWTMDDAKRARLDGRPAWRLYPRQMLLARASAELARAIFADAIGGLAAVEELEDDGAGGVQNGPPALGEAQAAPTRRRRRTKVTAAAEPAPAEQPVSRPPEDELPLPDEPAPLVADEPPPPPEEWPPPLPEQPALEDNTRRHMMAAFRDHGFLTSEQRHAFASFVLGRTIESSVDMVEDEARAVIEMLEQQPRVEPMPPPEDR